MGAAWWNRGTRACVKLAAVTAALLFWTGAGAAPAQADGPAKVYVMKISTPTINDTPDRFAKNFAAAIERDSGGRIRGEVYPASQLGSIPRQIEGVQFGAIQCAVIPPEFFAGIDERFQVLSAPGLVNSMAQGQRLAADPQVLKLMLGLGSDKGFHGVGLFMVNPNAVVARTPIKRIADFKGKKIRVFASQFQTVPFARLGATPVAMTLGDVVPALQQGAIDGALAGIPVLAAMHFKDAAKYATEIGQPAVFSIVELSRTWFDALPADLQKIVEQDAITESAAINPLASELNARSSKNWTDSGGELIELPPDEQVSLRHTLTAAAEDVAKSKPAISAAYQSVKDAARRIQQATQ